MLVVDASALAEYLVGSHLGAEAARYLSEHGSGLHIPHLAISETTSVLRSWVARAEMPEQRARAALDDLAAFPAARYPSEPLLPRIWQWRHNLSAYDAHYVALAEALDAPLLTADQRLARTVESSVKTLLLEPHQP